jgi:flavin-binding protein dodecin
MSTRTYQMIEIVGTSTKGLTEAIDSGIAKVAENSKDISWFEVTQIRGHVSDGKVAYYQVSLKVGQGL